MTDKQEQYKELNELVSKAYKAVNEAEAHARKYGLTFHFEVAYGMGGTFDGRTPEQQEEEYGYINSDSDGGWLSSSMSC